jgi:hypothetical protein
MPDNPSEEERKRMVDDAMKILCPPEKKTEEDLLVERLKDISREVHSDFIKMQILDHGLVSNKLHRYERMAQLYTDRLRQFEKEELLFVAVMLLVEAHIENV